MSDALRMVRLCDVAHVEMGQSPPSSVVSESPERGVAFLQGNAEFTAFNPRAKLYCAKPPKIAEAGDALISVRAPVGAINIADQTYCIGRGLAAVRFTGVDHAFGFHALSFHSRGLRRVAQGTTFEAIGGADLREMQFPLCSRREQRRIAAILDTLDEAIRKTEGIMVKLRQVEQGLLHDLLTRGVDESGGVRPLPSEAPGLYKNAGSDLIPTPWSTCPVGSVLARLEQGWSPDCSGHRAEHGEWGVLKTSAVTWDGYVDYQNKALPEGLPPKPEYEVHRLDVLITRAGPNSRVGVVAFVPKTQGRLMLSDKLYRLCPGREVTPRFLALALSAPRVQRHLSTLKTGLAESQTNISQAIVRELRMSLPPLSEQEAIVARFDAALDRAAAETRVLEKLATLRNGLAEDLLTGRVRVPMPEEATA